MRINIKPGLPASLLLLLHLCGFADDSMPGPASAMGRVLMVNNQIGVFSRSSFEPFPEEHKKQLSKHIGQYVKINYTLVRGFTTLGAAIGSIESIDVLHKDDQTLPLKVTINLTKDTYLLSEPIELCVKIKNRSSEKEALHLYASEAVVLQDYELKGSLSSHHLYSMKQPYGCHRVHTLQAGEEVSFNIVSSHYVEPSTYDVTFYVSRLRDLTINSNFRKVKVVQPKDLSRAACLKMWLSRNNEQLPLIAEDLLSQGDRTGIEKMIDIARTSYVIHAPRLLWKHGGNEAEAIILNCISKTKAQMEIMPIIEAVANSKNRISILISLLDNKHTVQRDFWGWVDEPRICDITASWLMGFSNEKHSFPESGTGEERDKAVRLVKKIIKTHPEVFSILDGRIH